MVLLRTRKVVQKNCKCKNRLGNNPYQRPTLDIVIGNAAGKVHFVDDEEWENIVGKGLNEY
jgi:hypothetical protein